MKFSSCIVIALLACGHLAFGQPGLISSHASTTAGPISNAASAAMRPAVRVNGAVVTEAEVVRKMHTMFPYAAQHGGFPKELEPDIRKGAIEMVVFEELLYQEAKRRKITIDSKRLSAAQAEFRDQLGSGDYEQFLRTECRGSKQVLREKIRRSLLIEKMIRTEVEQKSVVTESAARAYYDNNPKQFEKRESIHIQSISVIPPRNGGAAVDKEARRRAEEAYKLASAAKSYRDFGVLAEKISDDDWRVDMGDRKFVDISKLPPPVVQAAAAMKPGEVSNLIQLGNAYTIFRLVERMPAGRMPFAEVSARLQSDLQKQKQEELRVALGHRLRKDAKIEVL